MSATAILVYIVCLFAAVYIIARAMEYLKKIVYKDKASKPVIWLTAAVLVAVGVAFLIISNIAQYPLASLLGAHRWVDVLILYIALYAVQYKANMTLIKKGIKSLIIATLKGYKVSDEVIAIVAKALGIEEDT